MKVSSRHVFVCYGALSARATVLLVNALPVEQEVVVFSYVEISEAKSWPSSRRVFTLNVDWTLLDEVGKVSSVSAWFADSLRKAEIPAQAEIFAYFPHPIELPGNYFAFHEQRVSNRYMLPDGLINFVDRELRSARWQGRFRLRLRGYLRWFFARRHRLNYSPIYSGHLTQFKSVGYETTYSFGERGVLSLAGDLKVLPLPEPLEMPRAAKAKVILVDQELGELAGVALAAQMRISMKVAVGQELESLQAELIYRPHPRGQNRFEEMKAAFPNFKVLLESQRLSLEARAQSPDVQLVMSFFSTSLFLLASAELCRCRALLPSPEFSVNSAYCREVTKALRAVGVEVQLVA